MTPEDLPKQEPPEPSKEELLENVVKNLMVQIDDPQTKSRIERLKMIATRPLSLLSAEQCSDLDAIRKLTKNAYGTSVYDALHTLVTSSFNTSTIYSPHTVGSFFTGCITPTNLGEIADVNPGCALLCSDLSMPPPGQKWGFCSQNVVWCMLSSTAEARNTRRVTGPHIPIRSDHSGTTLPEKFDFIYMTYIPSSTKAILFVNYKTYDEFPGFTLHEKARLIHRMRITDIKLLSYELEAPNVYKDLIGSVSKVHKLKGRADPLDSETPAQRAARRASLNKNKASVIATDDESPITWDTAAVLSFALMMLVLLGIAAFVTITKLRSTIYNRH